MPETCRTHPRGKKKVAAEPAKPPHSPKPSPAPQPQPEPEPDHPSEYAHIEPDAADLYLAESDAPTPEPQDTPAPAKGKLDEALNQIAPEIVQKLKSELNTEFRYVGEVERKEEES